MKLGRLATTISGVLLSVTWLVGYGCERRGGTGAVPVASAGQIEAVAPAILSPRVDAGLEPDPATGFVARNNKKGEPLILALNVDWALHPINGEAWLPWIQRNESKWIGVVTSKPPWNSASVASVEDWAAEQTPIMSCGSPIRGLDVAAHAGDIAPLTADRRADILRGHGLPLDEQLTWDAFRSPDGRWCAFLIVRSNGPRRDLDATGEQLGPYKFLIADVRPGGPSRLVELGSTADDIHHPGLGNWTEDSRFYLLWSPGGAKVDSADQRWRVWLVATPDVIAETRAKPVNEQP